MIVSIARRRVWDLLAFAPCAFTVIALAYAAHVLWHSNSRGVELFFVALAATSMPLYKLYRGLQDETTSSEYEMRWRRAEKELKETREKLCNFLELSDDFVWEGDTTGVYTYASPRCRDILGRDPEEILGRRPHDLMEPEEAERLRDQIACHLAERKPFRLVNKTNVHRDGHRVRLQTTATPMFADDGTFLGFRGIDRDITEREDDRDELSRLATAIEAAGDAIVITDREGVIEYVNPAFERITCYRRWEAIGGTPRILKSGRQPAEVYERVWSDLLNKKRWSGHFVNKRKDGSFYDAEVTISPILSLSGAITGFVAVQRDVTEHVALLDRLRNAEEMERLGRLVAGVAHEVRNPLNAIQVATATLELDVTSDDTKPLFEVVHSQVERLTRLMHDLLEIGKPVLNTERCVAAKLCLDALSVWRGGHIEHGDRVRFAVPAEFDVQVQIDAVRMQQVIINLLDNAMQHSPADGEVVLGCDLQAEAVRIFVSDVGPGLDPQFASRIFEPFFTKRSGGTGLGLTIVKNAVERHGGRVVVRNRDDCRGTIAEVFLPASEGGKA